MCTTICGAQLHYLSGPRHMLQDACAVILLFASRFRGLPFCEKFFIMIMPF